MPGAQGTSTQKQTHKKSRTLGDRGGLALLVLRHAVRHVLLALLAERALLLREVHLPTHQTGERGSDRIEDRDPKGDVRVWGSDGGQEHADGEDGARGGGWAENKMGGQEERGADPVPWLTDLPAAACLPPRQGLEISHYRFTDIT